MSGLYVECLLNKKKKKLMSTIFLIFVIVVKAIRFRVE